MLKSSKSVPWLLLGLGLAGALGLIAILFFFDPSRYGFYPTCFLHRTTGLLCPGCGALRAMHQLLHGHFVAAFHFNPLLVISLPVCAWMGAASALRRARHLPATSLGLSSKWIWFFVAVALIFSIWRNLPGSPFAMLPG